MKKLIGIIVLFGIFSLSLNAHSASFDPSKNYRTLKTKHFAYHYPEELEDIAQRVANIGEELHAKMSAEFGWEPKGRTQALILDNNDVANGAATVLPYNWIMLRVTAPRPNTSLDYYDDWLRLLFAHEYTHILHLSQHQGLMSAFHMVLGNLVSLNGTVPGWYKEGITTYEESKQTGMGRTNSPLTDMFLRTAVLNDKLLKIDQADGLGWKWPSGYGMYLYGGEFIRWLSEKYGEDKLMELNKVIAGSPFLFMLNAQARMVYKRTFYDMWREWQEDLKAKYGAEIEQLKEKGVTPTEEAATDGTVLQFAVFKRNSEQFIYSRTSVDKFSAIVMKDLSTGKEEVVEKKKRPDQISVSPDGLSFVYSTLGATYDADTDERPKKTRYNFYSDIYLKKFGEKNATPLTTGKRATDPDFSPDGLELVFVTVDKGTARLNIMNIESKESNELNIDAPQFTQYNNPRWSPDGKMIAVSVWQEGGYRDIILYDRNGKELHRLQKDRAIDSYPAWSPDGRYVYFSSYKTGIANIFRYDVKSGKMEQVTNVLTGVFQPAISADGQTMLVQYYSGKGYDIRKIDLAAVTPVEVKAEKTKAPAKKAAQKGKQKEVASEGPGTMAPVEASNEPQPQIAAEGVETTDAVEAADHVRPANPATANRYKKTEPLKTLDLNLKSSAATESIPVMPPVVENEKFTSKKYTALTGSLFRPRFVMPLMGLAGEAFIVGGMTGGGDALRWHTWTAGVNYRTDSEHVGYFFSYVYNRYKPVFYVGFTDYSVDYGNLLFLNTSTGETFQTRYYEKRQMGYGGVSLPWKRHTFGLQYFYDDHKSIPYLPAFAENALNLGVFAGVNASYSYNNTTATTAAVSPEKGRIIRMNMRVTDSALGSGERNEQQIFSGEWREYIGTWNHQVLALRVLGGIAWGDTQAQGTFGFGGALGEGNLAGGGSLFYFPFRGLPVSTLARTRALVFSGEYRLPLVNPQRGLGTMPIFLQEIYLAPFVDYGNAWFAHENDGKNFFADFFLSTGLELNAKFYLGHGMPINGRLGYGIVVVNRDRLTGLKDPLLKYNVSNGTLILQFGTSF